MRKKFAITLICMTTVLYGSILFSSYKNDTNFFQEINHQLIRLQGILKYDQEVTFAKDVLKLIANNDTPPVNWQSYLERSLREFGDKAFYFSKIWLTESEISLNDIEKSYLIYIATNNVNYVLDLRFPGKSKKLQFNIFLEEEHKPLSGLFLPINNRDFSADYNNDGLINDQDLLLARQRINN